MKKPREHGSEFHWLDFKPGGKLAPAPWGEEAVFYGTGRQALQAVLAHGRQRLGWKRIWLPDYFCPELAGTIKAAKVPPELYADGPGPLKGLATADKLRRGDVVLRINFLGLNHFSGDKFDRPDGVFLIEDHTHDPFSEGAFQSRANWCLASLRKSLPLPDGAVLWSPQGRALPPTPAPGRDTMQASMQKFGAMALKERYLQGHAVEKEVFRDLALAGEGGLGQAGVSTMTPWSRTLLGTLPWKKWREARRANHAAFCRALQGEKRVQILQPEKAGACVPFCIAMIFPNHEWREKVRADLTAQDIYPFVLWPLDRTLCQGVTDAAMDMSRRILCLHCDMRYGKTDIKHVARTMKKSLGK